MSAPAEEARNQSAPPTKPRLAPKMGLQRMILYVMDLRLRARMIDGSDAKEAWLRLEPEDLEKLEDIADTLEFFRLQWSQQQGQQRRYRR